MVIVENAPRKSMSCISCMTTENCKTYSFSQDGKNACVITLCDTCQAEMCDGLDTINAINKESK